MALNRLQIALQGYESLASALSLKLDSEVSDDVEQWLESEVCPVVEQLAKTKRFQANALWSINHFSPSVKTAERQCVIAVERNIIETAKAVTHIIDVAVEEASPDDEVVSKYRELHQETANYIANKPWFDLVCTEDIFGPSQDLHLVTPSLGSKHTQAFRKRELRLPLGDYVNRYLQNRVQYWVLVLAPMIQGAFSLVPAGSGTSKRFKAIERIFSQKVKLDQSVEELIYICNESVKQKQREACVALTLVYSAYPANPLLQWLGDDESSWKVSGKIIRRWVRRRGTMQNQERDPSGAIVLTSPIKASLCDPTVIRQIACSLSEMAVFYDVNDDPDEMISEAVHRAKLVMVDRSPREVWFDGKSTGEIVWDNHDKSWNLLWHLALSGGHAIDHEVLAKTKKSNFRSRRKHLGNLLGTNSKLGALIESVFKLGYKLNLDAADIILLQDDGGGNLLERTPATAVRP